MNEQSPDLIKHMAARRQSADVSEPSIETHPLLRLQSQVGNAQIARLLAQRAEPEDEPDEDLLQAKHESVGVEGGPVGPDTSARIHSMRGTGAPLDESTRESMEAAIGTSFRDVRVHANSAADALNRQLTARAFTTGNDIFLRADANPSDARLIAHELTHVVQQRSMSSGGGMQVGAAGDAHEQQADAVAEAVSAAPTTQAPTAPTVQRQAADEGEDEPIEGEIQAQHDLLQRAEPEQDEEPLD